jgi:8-oxo-dGTP pyrophosphatase MutT (NUDIX family)
MNRRVAVRAIIFLDGKLLCVRLKPNIYTSGKGTFWCVPGGGLDDDEDLVSGLVREMVEETGVTPSVGNLLYIQQYKDKVCEHLEFLFEVTNTQDYLHIDLAKTTHGAKEIAELEFVDPSAVTLLPTFLVERSIQEDIAAGKTTYINNF